MQRNDLQYFWDNTYQIELVQSIIDSDRSADALISIKKKGIYSYSLITDEKKVAETELPPLEYWKNSVDDVKLHIAEEELHRAKTVFDTFQCRKP